MKAVIGVVVALMLAVGIYISLTNDTAQPTVVVSQETQVSSSSSTPDQVAQSPAETTASSDSQAIPVPTPANEIPAELALIAERTGEDFMTELMKYSGDVQSTINNLLQLIESGIITVDKRLFELDQNRAMSPLGMAVLMSQGDLSAEQFDRFIAAGAELHRDDMNTSFIAMVDNPEVMDTWYEAIGIGPEEHEEILNTGLIFGNTALADMVMQQKNGKLDQLEFGEFPVTMVIAQLSAVESIEREELQKGYDAAEPGTENITAEMSIARFQNNLDQIEILRRYGSLDDDQRARIDAAYEKVQNAIEVVNDIAGNSDN